MKKMLSLLCLLGIIGCKNHSSTTVPVTIDERDSVTGTYYGIHIHFNGDVQPAWDTTLAEVKLIKSDIDSLIIFCPDLNCNFYTQQNTFKYHNYTFIAIMGYHHPVLQYAHDSIIYHWQPSLGPIWDDYRCKKLR
jgi:hypothetical protein